MLRVPRFRLLFLAATCVCPPPPPLPFFLSSRLVCQPPSLPNSPPSLFFLRKPLLGAIRMFNSDSAPRRRTQAHPTEPCPRALGPPTRPGRPHRRPRQHPVTLCLRPPRGLRRLPPAVVPRHPTRPCGTDRASPRSRLPTVP